MAVGAGCDGVREEPACRFFWRNQTRCLQIGPSPSAERFFLRMFFGKGVIEACLARCEATRGGARVSSEEARCPLLRGPGPCALGDPSRAGAAGMAGAAGPAAGTRGPALPCLHWARPARVPAARLAVGSPGAREPRRLPLPECRVPHPAPGGSGLVPPTCSLLLTSRAAGTMGWGCHSNQTGRHNPGMCAAPPPCRRAAGSAATTSAGCGTRA